MEPRSESKSHRFATTTRDWCAYLREAVTNHGLFDISSGSTVLILVIMAVTVGIIVAMKNRQQPKHRDDGAQWFPLNNNNGTNRGREVLHTDEL